MTRKLDEDLDKQSYEIKDELKIRKEIEALTDWHVETTKNEDKYGYDLQFYRWDDDPEGPDAKKLGGFIELEHASEDSKYPWYGENPPEAWSLLTFLARKIRKYDAETGQWGGLKDEHHRTVYMKWNIPMTSCFVAPITTICREGEITKRSDGSYNNTYYGLKNCVGPGDYHPAVIIGPQESVDFIEEYLSNFEDGQESLLSFGEHSGTVKSDGGRPTCEAPGCGERISDGDGEFLSLASDSDNSVKMRVCDDCAVSLKDGGE